MPFLPEDFWPTGIVIACVCVCVSVYVPTFACPSDNSSHVPARIAWFRQKMQNILLKVPIVWGLIELDFPGQI